MAEQATLLTTPFTPAVKKTLAELSIADCAAHRSPSIYEVDASSPLSKAIDIMAKNGISSMPIYSSDDGLKTYIGFIDQLDIICYLNGLLQTTSVLSFAHTLAGTTCLQAVKSARSTSTNLNEFISVQQSASIVDTVFPFVKQGISRVPVVDETGQAVQIVSQSTLIHMLAAYIDDLPLDLTNQTLEDLNIGLKKVVSVAAHDLVATAIAAMATHRLHALAVVSEDGKLMTNIGSSDVILALAHNLSIHTTVQHLVSTVRRQLLFSTRGSRSFPAAVTCHPDHTLKGVITKLAATGLHRLYVTNDGFPVGVVSLVDILKIIAK